jgi:hypothetical protein
MTDTMTFVKKAAPDWLLAFWKEIDDKTFGKGFDCFLEDATCRLGVAEWNGRETIRESLRAFIDTGSRRTTRACAPSSTPGSRRTTTSPNIGTAERSRSSGALSR